MILYSRLDIYPNRDGFYIQARPTVVNHRSRECERKKRPKPKSGKRSARCHTHDLHKRIQNKNPGLRANSKILYSTIVGDGSTMQMQMWYSKTVAKDKARDLANLQGVNEPSEGVTLGLDLGLELAGLAESVVSVG